MTKIYQFIALAALALGFAACTQEDEFTPQGNQKDAPLALTSAGVAELTTTRATITDNCLVGGSIGVYVDSEGADKYKGENVKWTYSNGWELADSETKVLYEQNESSQKILAYYPYSTDATDDGKITVNLPATYGSNYEDYDYLYAYPTAVNANPMSLRMSHAFAKVVAKVGYTGTSLGNATVTSIAVEDVPTSADWAVNDEGILTYGASTGKIQMYYDETQYNAIILPNSAETISLLITMSNNDTYRATLDLWSHEYTVTAGRIYDITLRVGKDNVTVSNISVQDWSKGEDLGKVGTTE